ncbi:MAG: haloalkane dehalogenase [archaeon]|nr:haloalkane dehalogenase [archaeon]
MKLLRTPKDSFKKIPDFPFEPHYLEVKEGEESIRIHYVDEGPKDAEPILLMHGEPSWSYLYRHMIPIFIEAGYRVLAPDLVGFGKSDKPTEKSDYTYKRHISWIKQWLLSPDVNIHNTTLFCQDWGSLIGLRIAIDEECSERISRIVLSNGGLGSDLNKWSEGFFKWLDFSLRVPSMDVGRVIQNATLNVIPEEVMSAYNAPFPDDSYKAGVHIFPSLVPNFEDNPEFESNRNALIKYRKWKKPFLTAFGDSDTVTKGMDSYFQKNIPGAKGQKHTSVHGGHFIQEDAGPELAKITIEFMKSNPI